MTPTPQQPAFDTMTEAIQALQSQGYTYDFNLDDTCLRYANGTLVLYPEDFQIDFLYRFEGETDPGDENVVYAIASSAYSVKGILVSAYGMYADTLCAEMIEKLRMR